MARRAYDDGCAVAHALNLVGERWGLLVVRELLLGPKRFADLQAGLPGAGPTILTQRLRQLQEVGVIRRRALPRPAASNVYELTEWGGELAPIIAGLGRWGVRSPVVAPAGPAGPDSHMLSLQIFFQPQPNRPWTANYEIWLGDHAYFVRVVDGQLTEVRRGECPDPPDARIETDGATFGALLSGRQQLKTARATVTGGIGTVRRLLNSVRIA